MTRPRARYYDGVTLKEMLPDECDNERFSPFNRTAQEILNTPGEFFSGYRYDLEDRELIFRESIPRYAAWAASFPDDYVLPDPPEFDPSTWHQIENQSSMGSCQGHAASSSAETTIGVTTGVHVQLSRGFCYLASQEFDGLLGGDRGSTLAGGAKALARGIPLESEFPYALPYRDLYNKYRQRKDAILGDPSKLYKIPEAFAITEEEACKKFLLSRSGTIEIGISWTLPDQYEQRSYRSGSGGGHAICIGSVVKHDSWPYAYKLWNSWGTNWGRNGICLLHPECVQQMLRARYTVFLGFRGAVLPPGVTPPKPDI